MAHSTKHSCWMTDLRQKGRHPNFTNGGPQAAGQRVLCQPAGHKR